MEAAMMLGPSLGRDTPSLLPCAVDHRDQAGPVWEGTSPGCEQQAGGRGHWGPSQRLPITTLYNHRKIDLRSLSSIHIWVVSSLGVLRVELLRAFFVHVHWCMCACISVG